jgi:asparagine synthase (glutamine-hydrolysing)
MRPGDRIHKLAEVLSVSTAEGLYRALVSHWAEPQELVACAREPHTALSDPTHWPRLPEFKHRLMYLDAVSYLPDDILVKVDRAAMGASLETRAPLLDHRVVEFAWHLPLTFKVRDGQGKRILRRLLAKYVPEDLTSRPKMGFGVPIGDWLRGPLRNWAEALLDDARLQREGYFNSAPIRRKWEEHLSGNRNWQYHLWDVLMFQAWLAHQKQ